MIVFRPLYRYYIYPIALFLLFSGVLVVMVVGFSQVQISPFMFLFCGMWSAILAGVGLAGIFRLQRVRLSLDEQNLQAQFGSTSFSIAWKEILMIRMIEKFLEVATKSNHHLVHLKDLDSQQVWEYVQQYAPQPAITDDAYLSVPAYQQVIAEYQLILQEEGVILRAGFPHVVQIVRWLVFVVLLAPGFIILSDESTLLFVVIYFAFITIPFGGFAFQSLRALEVTAHSVVVKNGIWRHELHWNEIERIKTNLSHQQLIFYGQKKKLVGPGLAVWGRNNEKLKIMIYAQVWRHQIKLEDRNRSSPFFLLRNLPASQK